MSCWRSHEQQWVATNLQLQTVVLISCTQSFWCLAYRGLLGNSKAGRLPGSTWVPTSCKYSHVAQALPASHRASHQLWGRLGSVLSQQYSAECCEHSLLCSSLLHACTVSHMQHKTACKESLHSPSWPWKGQWGIRCKHILSKPQLYESLPYNSGTCSEASLG